MPSMSKQKWVSYLEFKNKFKEIKGVSNALEEARATKEKDEIDKLKKACDIVSKVADQIPSYEFKTENELAAEIEYQMKKLGASDKAFRTISSSGENSFSIHFFSSNKEIKRSEFVLCDFGAVYDNLPGDFQAKKTLIRDFNPAGSASGNAQIVLFLATFPVKHPSKP